MMCIELYDVDFWEEIPCDVHDRLPPSIHATPLSVLRHFWETCRVYAEDGMVWRPEPTRRPPFPILLLFGLFDLTWPITMSYAPEGPYELADLKDRLGKVLSSHAREPRGVCVCCLSGAAADAEHMYLCDQLDRLDAATSFVETARVVREFFVVKRQAFDDDPPLGPLYRQTLGGRPQGGR